VAELFDSSEELPDGLLEQCRPMPLPMRVLLCPPEYFDVVDVKNPYMEGKIGLVDSQKATVQWEQVRAAFEQCGATVELIDAAEGCEDMVFCANQTLAGLDGAGERLCLLSQMKHPSRQREVPAFERWFEREGYAVVFLPGDEVFEGGGDAIWHPSRGLIWGGYGIRTEPGAYVAVSDYFEVPVIRLRLSSDRTYHLDTSLCPLDESTALIHAGSFEPAALEMIRRIFPTVLESPTKEAIDGMACNAAAVGGTHVVINRGNPHTASMLREHGYQVVEVDTSEFVKSGGSVFCMKMYVF